LPDARAGTPRLVALDVDGTLVDLDSRMSDAVRHQVRRVAAVPGTSVVVATGRELLGALPVMAELALPDGFVVCSNGAVTARIVAGSAGSAGSADGDNGDSGPSYEIVERVTFDATPAVTLLREHLPEALFAVEVLGVGYRVTGRFPDGELPGELIPVPIEELTAEPVTRVVVRSPQHTPEDFLELTSRIGLHGVSYAVGWTAWLDLAPEGVTKASALEQVRRRLGVEPADTFAVGDGRNDVEMIRWAAHGAVMGSAPPEVLAVADEVLPDVTRDGLVTLLRRL
jgi:hydroxymethylpyrimidine pyrophosphatase-like HAD family hydrolase